MRFTDEFLKQATASRSRKRRSGFENYLDGTTGEGWLGSSPRIRADLHPIAYLTACPKHILEVPFPRANDLHPVEGAQLT